MISFQAIRQSILDMEYRLDNRQSFLLLCPGVSLICEKIQIAALINKVESTYNNPSQTDDVLNSHEFAQINKIYKWHIYGSLIQTITTLFLAAIHPLFLVPAAVAFFEACYSFDGLTHQELTWKSFGAGAFKLHINK